MSRIKIVADRSIPYLPLGIPSESIDICYLPSEQITRSALMDADALMVRSVTRCDEELLGGTPIRLITTATAGTDHIDAAYCQTAGIEWYNAPGCNAMGVVQYVLCALSFIARQENRSLKGRTIGIVGVGHVGSRLAVLTQAMGMKTLLVDPPRVRAAISISPHMQATDYSLRIDQSGVETVPTYSSIEDLSSFVSLEEAACRCDIISFHTPLTHLGQDATYHMADDAFFRICAEKRPLIINAARGGVIDTRALKNALVNKKLRGAVIDCWEGEPVIDKELLELTLLSSPHIAGFSAHGKARGTAMSLSQVGQFFNIPLPQLERIQPHPPLHPVIDLSSVPKEWMAEQALLHTLDPREADEQLRLSPETFELQRVNYFHRPEMCAYSVRGVHDENIRSTLLSLGFSLC